MRLGKQERDGLSSEERLPADSASAAGGGGKVTAGGNTRAKTLLNL